MLAATDLPKGADGRNLCRWCELEVPKGRFTFCSDFCVEEWRLRTDAGFLREKTLARDKGICALCSVDTVAAYIALKRSRGAAKVRLLQHWGLKTINSSDVVGCRPHRSGGGRRRRMRSVQHQNAMPHLPSRSNEAVARQVVCTTR